MKKKLQTIFMTMVLAVVMGCSIHGNVLAASDTISLLSDGEESETQYELQDIYKIPAGAVVTLSTDAPDVVQFRYWKWKVTKRDSDYDVVTANAPLVLNSSEIRHYDDSDEDQEDLPVGKWITNVSVASLKAGNAVVTMTVAYGGTETTTSYQVTVKPIKPSVVKIAWKKQVTAVSDTNTLYIKNTTKTAKVTMSANKKDAFRVIYSTGDEFRQKVIGKKATAVEMEVGYNTVGEFDVIPLQSGSIALTVTVEQDGYRVSKTWKTKAAKYENPVQTCKIGGKNFAKKFDKWSVLNTGVSNGNLSVKEAKKTLGKSFDLKLKKGYQLVKITYRVKDEWTQTPHVLKEKKLPKDVWELYIYYKDKKGKTRKLMLNYDMQVFM